MFQTSYIEIDRTALAANLQFLRGMLGEEVRFSSVVKGNAYGHGIECFVPLAEEFGVDHFSVFGADEALRVSKVSRGKSTIMIMGMLGNEEIEWAIENGVEFFVFEKNRLEKALEVAQKTGIPAKVHIELETGMNRTGFAAEELEEVGSMLKANPYHLQFCGLCTHYAGAESVANYLRVKSQHVVFRKIAKKFKEHELEPEYLHTACSAAAMRYPKTRMDLVRIGILQYGFFPSREIMVHHYTEKEISTSPIRRLLSWKSQVMSVKTVKAGEFIGYGTSFLTNSETRIATVPVGYSHGFSRTMSNRGRVLIRGKRVSVIGMVNMNMMIVDVSDLNHVEQGDEVVIIGKQGDLEISVSAFGEYSYQVNYELLTRLPAHIPRKVVD